MSRALPPPQDDRPRWEQAAERVRSRTPKWLSFDRLPWWLALLIGIGWAVWGGYQLVAGDSLPDRVFGALLMVLPPTGMVMRALRLRRGEPFHELRGPGD